MEASYSEPSILRSTVSRLGFAAHRPVHGMVQWISLATGRIDKVRILTVRSYSQELEEKRLFQIQKTQLPLGIHRPSRQQEPQSERICRFPEKGVSLRSFARIIRGRWRIHPRSRRKASSYLQHSWHRICSSLAIVNIPCNKKDTTRICSRTPQKINGKLVSTQSLRNQNQRQ